MTDSVWIGYFHYLFQFKASHFYKRNGVEQHETRWLSKCFAIIEPVSYV